MNLIALTSRHAEPQLIRDLLLDHFDEVVQVDVRPGVFGLACFRNERLRLLVCWQWMEPYGWTYWIKGNKTFPKLN